MSNKKFLYAVFLIIIICFSSRIQAGYLENFSGYEAGDVLTGRATDNLPLRSINGYMASTRTLHDKYAGGIGSYGLRKLVVKKAEGDLGNYIVGECPQAKGWAGITIWEKERDGEITKEISGSAIVVYEITYMAHGHPVKFSPGIMWDVKGTHWDGVFTFQDKGRNFIIKNAIGENFGRKDTDAEAPGHTMWIDVRFVIDLKANGGNGSLDVYWKKHNARIWKTKGIFEGINLKLKGNPEIADSSKWSCWKCVLDGWCTVINRQRLARVKAYGMDTKANAMPAELTERPVKPLRLKPETSNYLDQTVSKTRSRIILNGTWEINNIAGVPALDPFDKKQQKDPTSPFPDPPTDEIPPKTGWKKISVPLISVGHSRGKGLEWYRRSFTVPGGWSDKRVLVRFDAISYQAVVYINGRYVGWTNSPMMRWDVDITDFVKFDQPNELTVRLRYGKKQRGDAWPNVFRENNFPGGGRDGIMGDVFLLAQPGICTNDVFLKPSYRKNRLDVDYEFRNDTKKSRTIQVKSFVTELTGAKVIDLPEMKVVLKSGEVKSISGGGKWADPRLWSDSNPYLYLLETHILDKKNNIIDIHKERFGFCERWIDNGEFYVNGKLVQFNQTNTIVYDLNDRRLRAMWYRNQKALGYNMVRSYSCRYPSDMETADEVGIYLKESWFWHHPEVKLSPSLAKDLKFQVPRWIRRARNHPSIAMWCTESEAFSVKYKARKLSFQTVRETDPTRPIDTEGAYHTQIYDAAGKVRSGPVLEWMDIIDPHYPSLMSGHHSLLHVVDLLVPWSKTKPKPMFLGEWGAFIRPGAVSRPARYFEEAFNMREFGWWRGAYSVPASVDYLAAVVPYWSRLGVGGHSYFGFYSAKMLKEAPSRGNYPVSRKMGNIPIIWESEEGQLGTRQTCWRYWSSSWKINPFYPDLPGFKLSKEEKEIAELYRPLYAFFMDRTYAVYGGRVFKRKLCLLNRSNADVIIKGTAKLIVGDEVKASRPFSVSIAQGKYKDVSIEFPLPQVDRRTNARVVVKLDKKEETWASRPLKLAIWPKLSKVSLPKKVVLYDPQGQTKSAMQKIDVQIHMTDMKTGIPDDTDVLVIGYRSLDERVQAAAKEILRFVKQGGYVVCLAQKAKNATEWLPQTLTRDPKLYVPQVVRITDGSNLFAGMKARDLSYWPNDRDNPDKVVGTVSRYPFIKPKAGCVRSLLECGVNFDRSAMLEFYSGKGAVVLSQLEIVPVVGESPVADLLLQRLICRQPKTLPARKVWYVTDAEGENILKNRLNIESSDISLANGHTWSSKDLILWMPYSKKDVSSQATATVKKALAGGASLLAFAPDVSLLPPLQSPPIYKTPEEYKGRVFVWENGVVKMALLDYDNPLATSLSNAEFFRQINHGTNAILATHEIGSQNNWKRLTRPGVIARRPSGESTHVVCTIVREVSTKAKKTGKMTSSYQRILLGLLTNLGAVSHDSEYLMRLRRSKADFSFVDLRTYANLGFHDKISQDKKGGFSDQGAMNLGNLPTGRQTFNGIPFDIIVPEKNNDKTCIALGGKLGGLDWLPKGVKNIAVGGKKAAYIHFLHTGSWGAGSGYYLIRYHRVSEMTRKVLIGRHNITDWTAGKAPDDAKIAWRGESDSGMMLGIYSYAWKNPIPQFSIESIDFIGDSVASKCLIAVTIEGLQK